MTEQDEINAQRNLAREIATAMLDQVEYMAESEDQKNKLLAQVAAIADKRDELQERVAKLQADFGNQNLVNEHVPVRVFGFGKNPIVPGTESKILVARYIHIPIEDGDPLERIEFNIQNLE